MSVTAHVYLISAGGKIVFCGPMDFERNEIPAEIVDTRDDVPGGARKAVPYDFWSRHCGGALVYVQKGAVGYG